MPNDSDPLDRLPAWLKALVLQGREVWHLFKTFGDLLGETIIQGLLAGQAAVDFFRRPGGWILFAAMVGGVSPLTGGLGIDWLSRSSLSVWSPVGFLPTAVISMWLLRKSLALLNREGERDASRRQRERPQPGVKQQLAADARRRMELNAGLQFKKDLPNLEDASFCHDILVDTLRRIRARFGNQDIAIVLERFTKKKGFKVVESAGGPDREVKAQLQVGMVDGQDVDQVLNARLSGLQYRYAKIEFSIGSRRYLLLAVSGATIPEDVLAEISEATVLFVEEYAWAARSLDSMSGQA